MRRWAFIHGTFLSINVKLLIIIICSHHYIFFFDLFSFYLDKTTHCKHNLIKIFFSFFRLLCRLTYALCLNFLSVIHLDSHITGVLNLEDTAFTSVRLLRKK